MPEAHGGAAGRQRSSHPVAHSAGVGLQEGRRDLRDLQDLRDVWLFLRRILSPPLNVPPGLRQGQLSGLPPGMKFRFPPVDSFSSPPTPSSFLASSLYTLQNGFQGVLDSFTHCPGFWDALRDRSGRPAGSETQPEAPDPLLEFPDNRV